MDTEVSGDTLRVIEGDESDSRTPEPLGGRTPYQYKRAVDRSLRVPVSRRKAYMRSVDGTASPRQAIKAQCYDCIGQENAFHAIANCRGYTCPLYAYRPYQEVTQ